MTVYYFDIREGDKLYLDEEGFELPDLRSAEIEAARSLAGMARDQLPIDADKHQMAIEVRTADGPLFKAAFTFEVGRTVNADAFSKSEEPDCSR
jgi:hypothetical protein